MSKKNTKVKTNAEEPIVLDIPEDEIWTYQVEGLAAPHINKPYKHFGFKKLIFALVIIVAVSLSMYFSVRTVQKETFEYEQTQSGYTLTKFSNNGFITEIDIDFVSAVIYADENDFALAETEAENDFIIKKDESKKITAVGPYTLNCDEKVKIINIGADVEYIDPKAFYSCWALKQIEVDENNPNYCDIDGVLYKKDKKTIICRPCDHDTYLAEKYGYAKYDANGYRIEPFADNEDYKKHYYFYNVINSENKFADFETVEKYFEDEDNKKSLDEFFAVKENGVTQKNDSGFWGKIKSFFVKNEDEEADTVKTNQEKFEDYFKDEKNYNEYCEKYFNPYYDRYVNDVLTFVVPSTVEIIGELCFNYANMKTVYLPEGVKTIETLGFFEIPNLQNIYSYKTDSVISDSHFVSESLLGEVYVSLPEGLESIGSDAFSYNRELTYMYIPSSVKYIGHHAFWDTVYKEGDELRGVSAMNVAVSEEEFKDKVKTGDSWLPQYDFMLFKKSIDVNYNSIR